jgi:hypothetical protein
MSEQYGPNSRTETVLNLINKGEQPDLRIFNPIRKSPASTVGQTFRTTCARYVMEMFEILILCLVMALILVRDVILTMITVMAINATLYLFLFLVLIAI